MVVAALKAAEAAEAAARSQVQRGHQRRAQATVDQIRPELREGRDKQGILRLEGQPRALLGTRVIQGTLEKQETLETLEMLAAEHQEEHSAAQREHQGPQGPERWAVKAVILEHQEHREQPEWRAPLVLGERVDV